MKYVIPVTIDHDAAAKLLDGRFPATATATRAKLAAIVEKKIVELANEPRAPVVEPVEIVQKPDASTESATKKSARQKKRQG
ncbi:MAG: hypothetical protein IJL92_07760 [Thermoguttaceae bacterium]|nr:hypothetical protein [Thermoguttaceae bacterium]